jgi:hypothetical protein
LRRAAGRSSAARTPSPIPQHSILLFSTPVAVRSTVMYPSLSTSTEMCGLMLRGKFSEDHLIARGSVTVAVFT